MYVLLAFLQSAADAVTPSTIPQLVISGGGTGLVLYLWQRERKDRETARKEEQAQAVEERKRELARYEAIAMDFRTIVQDNTRAMSSLAAGIQAALAGNREASREAVQR